MTHPKLHRDTEQFIVTDAEGRNSDVFVDYLYPEGGRWAIESIGVGRFPPATVADKSFDSKEQMMAWAHEFADKWIAGK